MFELLDLLRDWLEGDIVCQIEDVHRDDYILFHGTVSKAYQKFRKLADTKGISYELYTYMQIDPTNGLLYIQVEEM